MWPGRGPSTDDLECSDTEMELSPPGQQGAKEAGKWPQYKGKGIKDGVKLSLQDASSVIHCERREGCCLSLGCPHKIPHTGDLTDPEAGCPRSESRRVLFLLRLLSLARRRPSSCHALTVIPLCAPLVSKFSLLRRIPVRSD